MTAWIFVAVAYYSLFIYTWVKGLGLVQEHQPDSAVKFYFIIASMRFVMALTIVALFMMLGSHTHREAVLFCTTFSLMYAAAIIISVTLKH